MSTATEKALQRRVVLLERRLAIMEARFNLMNKAAALMGGGWEHELGTRRAYLGRPRPRHLHPVDGAR